ncbi:MAG: cupredoxin domain-containing protein [Thaumarchaeota archaeon]|nr:cupredoxin domain-containing protein [Nitrososphaerota archaeon]
METEYPSRPGRGFLFTVGAVMVLLGVLLAAELSPIAGHPLQPPLGGGGNAVVPGGTVVMPQGVGSNTQLNFSPATVVAVIGINNTITFKNSDSVTHTVTATDHSFDSADILPGKGWTNTFSTPGNFSYYCVYHQSWMKGTIVVTRSTGVTVIIADGTGSNPSLNYSPSSLLLVVGVNNTVTFVNQDSTNHTVTASDQSFDSKDIQPGRTWSHTFAVGTFAFHCVYHTYMAGTITVKSP